MLEIEKKFTPTKEQLKNLLSNSIFVREDTNRDTYYDTRDFSLLKQGIFLRERNKMFELKECNWDGSIHFYHTKAMVQIATILTDEKLIAEKLNITEPLTTAIQQKFIALCTYSTNRRIYTKQGFVLAVDHMDFGYDILEIKISTSEKSSIEEIKENIINFAQKHGIAGEDVLLKPIACIRQTQPEFYK